MSPETGPRIMEKYRSNLMKCVQEEGWVVCRAFKKRTTGQTKNIEAWESSYFYDEPSGVSSVADPLDYMTKQPQNYPSQNFICKQEIEQAETLNSFINSDPYVQLPQLESPSMPLVKRPSSISLITENTEEDENIRGCSSSSSKKMTDWRALDKFVASQLSHEERYEDDVVSGFEAHDSSDLGLLLQIGREEESNLNGILSSSLDCDIGICVFDK